MRFYLIAILLSTIATTVSAEPLVVLGLPLGGKLSSEPKICPFGATQSKALCWVDRPYIAKDGGKLGMVAIPEKDLPTWAMYQLPNIEISKDRTLNEIRFFNESFEDKRLEIIGSISGRFGDPKISTYGGTISVEWKKPDINVNFGCTKLVGCVLTFRSAAFAAQMDALAKKRQATDDARPKTP